MSLKSLIIDVWTGLSLKSGMDETTSGMPARSRDWVAPTWVGYHARRLLAYKILKAYSANRGREFLASTDLDERRMHREYGDVALLINVVLAAVMGDDVAIVVEGSDEQENTTAVARQAEVDAWQEDERYRSKMLETERDAQTLGDGVYVLTLSSAKERARLRLFDPGFYFPVLDPNLAEDEFPTRVHVAWQYEEQVDGGRSNEVRQLVRRMTWDLRRLPAGESRSHPWNEASSEVTCYFSDGIWELGDLDGRDFDHFPTNAATWMTGDDGKPIQDLDLQIDFLPVVHLTNTVAIKEGFGEALITSVAQLVDDLAQADTDASFAARLAGTPMIAASVEPNIAQDLAVRPGAVFGVGREGSMVPLDLSASLVAIMSYIEGLQARLSENKRVPAEVLGRRPPAAQESGLRRMLAFGPLRSLVEEMRLVRAEKYSLLWKFVQRMQIAGGHWSGDVLPVRVKFGSYLPSDQAATIEAVAKLYAAKLISRSTAIAWLVNEGIIDVVVSEELEAAEAEDFAAALALLEATDGDHEAVYELLHRDLPDDTGVVDEPVIDPTVPLPQLPAARPQSVAAAAVANGSA